METKMRSEKSGTDNLELVIASISEDLKSNIESNSNLIGGVENLNISVSELLEIQKFLSRNYEVDILAMKKELKEIRNDITGISFPEIKMNELSEKLAANSSLLKNPAGARVIHHHHLSKITWIAAILWVAFTLSITGLLVINEKLNGFKENDIKFRHLKLDTNNRSLQLILDREDSVYNSNPDFKSAVIKTEQQYIQNFERLKKANRLKAEAKNLEKQATEK